MCPISGILANQHSKGIGRNYLALKPCIPYHNYRDYVLIFSTCLSHISASKFPSCRWAPPCKSDTSPPSLVHCTGNFGEPTWPYVLHLFRRARPPSVIGQHTWVNTRNTEHCILQCILQLQSKDHKYPKKCAHGSFLLGPYLNFSGAAAWTYISTINNLPVIYRAPQLIESKWNIQQGEIHCGSQIGILTISDFW